MLIGITALLLLAIPLTINGNNSTSSQTTLQHLSDVIFVAQNHLIPTTTERLKLALSYYSRKYGTDCELIDKIIFCESSWDEDAKNPDSSASGLAQFLDSTFSHYCSGDKDNPYHQLECMTQMIADGGLSHWNESKHCWGN